MNTTAVHPSTPTGAAVIAPEEPALSNLPRLACDDVLGWLDERLGTRRWSLTIDGRSGSGKTVLSGAVAERHPTLQVLHLDDLYRDWDRLPSGVVRARHMVEMWQRGEAPSYLPTQWPGMAPRASVTIDPARPLAVEGCGATWVGRGIADAQVWLDVDTDVRRARALGRDGEAFAPFWQRWRTQEDHWYADHPPRPDVVVCADRSGGGRADPPVGHGQEP